MNNSESDNNLEQNVPFLPSNILNKFIYIKIYYVYLFIWFLFLLKALNSANTQKTVIEILLSIEGQNNLIMKERSIMKLVQDRLLNKINGLELNIQGNSKKQ